MNALSKNHKHGHVKPKYNAKPSADEKAYHIALIDNNLCVCGCGQQATIVHHVLQSSIHKRWRRDHLIVVPMFWECHHGVHANGSEIAWQEAHGIDLIHEAIQLRNEAVYKGILNAA